MTRELSDQDDDEEKPLTSEPCEVDLYYWGTFPLAYLFYPLYVLVTCCGRLHPFRFLKSDKWFSTSGHISMEVRYDYSTQTASYRRSYYISLYPDSDKTCSECIPRLAVMHGRTKDLDEKMWPSPSKKIVLTGLNFAKIRDSINNIFKIKHSLDGHRKWSISNDVMQERDSKMHDYGKDTLHILSIDPVRWGLIKCCCKIYSCSTIVNEILVDGGLKVGSKERCGRVVLSSALVILVAILAILPALIDYVTDHYFDHSSLDILWGVFVGILGSAILYEHGLAFDELFCCNKSPFIRPQSVVWKAEHSKQKPSISTYKNCCFYPTTEPRNFNLGKKYNSPIDQTNSLRISDEKYVDHVCSA